MDIGEFVIDVTRPYVSIDIVVELLKVPYVPEVTPEVGNLALFNVPEIILVAFKEEIDIPLPIIFVINAFCIVIFVNLPVLDNIFVKLPVPFTSSVYCGFTLHKPVYPKLFTYNA